MNARITGALWVAVLASPAVAAPQIQEPPAVLVPSTTVTAVLQYLNTRPYQEVAGIIQGFQRCLQDQLPDDKGIIAERGQCPEISPGLAQLKQPLSPKPPKATPGQ